MTGLHHFWTAVWPNLAANVVWLPLVGGYHWWTRRRFDALHAIIRELHVHLNDQEQRSIYSTELNVNTTINWRKIFKSPQAVVSLLVAAVTTAGTAGLIDTDLSGAIQTLLVAVLGVIAAVTHVSVSAKVAERQAQKALDGGEDK
jgi:hypothetical protein